MDKPNLFTNELKVYVVILEDRLKDGAEYEIDRVTAIRSAAYLSAALQRLRKNTAIFLFPAIFLQTH